MSGKESREAAPAEKRSYWENHIATWQAGPLSQTEYCRRHDLKYHQFIYWKKRLCPARPASVSLIEVPVSVHPSPLHSALKVDVGSGLRIEVEPGFDPVTLQQLIHVLRQM